MAGNPGHHRLNKSEPQFKRLSVTCPAFLDKVAKREYMRLIRVAPAKLITAADRGTLAAMCQLYSRAIQAEEKIRTDGAVITTTNLNVIQSPWVGMANKAWSEYARLATEFGLTPSSRSRLDLPPEDKKKSLKEMLSDGDIQFIEAPVEHGERS